MNQCVCLLVLSNLTSYDKGHIEKIYGNINFEITSCSRICNLKWHCLWLGNSTKDKDRKDAK